MNPRPIPVYHAVDHDSSRQAVIEMNMMECHFILYVKDHRASTAFYTSVLDRAPELDVAGMTEFRLASGAMLGLMSMSGIRRCARSCLIPRWRGNPVRRCICVLMWQLGIMPAR